MIDNALTEMTCWQHQNPVMIHGGYNALAQLPELLPEKGAVLLVTTAGFTRRGTTQRLIDRLDGFDVKVYDQVTPNPELDALESAMAQFKREDISAIVAIGGGSVLDAAKVLSVTLPSDLSTPLVSILRDGLKHTWEKNLPLIAIPTTSGTGAEVTPFATVWDNTTHSKHSVMGDKVYPAIALLSPELTISLPYKETLYTGLDAISHALESLWNKNKTPVSEAYSLQALSLALQALPIALQEPEHIDSRARMQQASVLAGLAISQTRTAIAHSVSYPLTSYFNVPHGLACSFTLPKLIELHLQETPNMAEHIKALLSDIKKLLDNLQLKDCLREYASDEEVIKLAPKMFKPGRADNFIHPITDVTKLL